MYGSEVEREREEEEEGMDAALVLVDAEHLYFRFWGQRSRHRDLARYIKCVLKLTDAARFFSLFSSANKRSMIRDLPLFLLVIIIGISADISARIRTRCGHVTAINAWV